MPAFVEFIDRLIAALQPPLSAAMLPGLEASPFAGLPWPPPPAEPGESDVALEAIAAAIRDLSDPFQAARLCLLAGAFVEQGAPAAAVVGPIAERARSTFASARRFIEEIDPDRAGIADPAAHFAAHPREVAAYLGAEYTGMAAMTTLCREKSARIAARGLPGLRDDADYLRGTIPTGYYLSELLASVDDFAFEAIHPEQRRGYRLRADGVRNNFHLFTLLQSALIGEAAAGWLSGPALDPQVGEFARGRSERPPVDHDQAVWTFSAWPAWSREGLSWLPAYWVWGEGSPHDIRPFRDTPIILLSPLSIGGRSWGLEFCAPLHGAHQAELTVESQMSAEEVDRRLAALVAESA